jgi:3-oxoacyl-[acyl-carrier-protein] synthase-3
VRAAITGWGLAAPEGVLSNTDLEARLDTNDAWILDRTGIRERRYAGPGEGTSSLAIAAGGAAIKSAGLAPGDIDLMIMATTSPDQVIPHTGAFVGDGLGLRCGSFDLNAACAGFVYELVIGSAMVAGGGARNVLLIGGETLSRLVDPDDRSTTILFGDGAAAVVVARGQLELGCAAFELGSDGVHGDLLYADADERLIRMEGREVYRHAVRRMVEATQAALHRCRLNATDLDLFVAHQANARIVEAAADQLGLPRERVALNVDHLANTSSASIPLALWEAERNGALRAGDRVGLAAFGAGFVWGAGVVSWKERVHVCA